MMTKKILLNAYFAAAAFFTVALLLNFGFFELGICIAILNTLLTDSILETIEKGNKSRELKIIIRFKFAKNLLTALLICYFIAWVRYMISVNITEVYLEPISFGLIYSALYMGVITLFSKMKTKTA